MLSACKSHDLKNQDLQVIFLIKKIIDIDDIIKKFTLSEESVKFIPGKLLRKI